MVSKLRRAIMEFVSGKKQRFLYLDLGRRPRSGLAQPYRNSFELHLSAFKGPME
jgi:hypothetical protein